MRYKVAIRFVIDDDLRFISHHDTMRLFSRALSRARLPVKYSRGFNPRPRLSLPLPRPVGIASDADLAVIELNEPGDPDVFRKQLSGQMPASLRLIHSWLIAGGRSPQPRWAQYAVPLGQSDIMDPVADQLDKLRTIEAWLIERTTADGKPGKLLDAKDYLDELILREGTLLWRARITGQGTIRPAEVLSAVGLDPVNWQHLVRRVFVGWDPEPPTDTSPAQNRTGDRFD